MIYSDCMTSPLGLLRINASDKGITNILFIDDQPSHTHSNTIIDQCKFQLSQYFDRKSFSFSVPMDTSGTHFQQSVWQALINIPYGEVASYRDIANSIHNPKAVRAVGAANGKNPISIIVPCHRVIGSDGSLTGYAWGIERKKWLLEHEAKSSVLMFSHSS